jgi:hypothetical protein
MIETDPVGALVRIEIFLLPYFEIKHCVSSDSDLINEFSFSFSHENTENCPRSCARLTLSRYDLSRSVL